MPGGDDGSPILMGFLNDHCRPAAFFHSTGEIWGGGAGPVWKGNGRVCAARGARGSHRQDVLGRRWRGP